MRKYHIRYANICLLITVLTGSLFGVPPTAHADIASDIAAKQQQIQQLQLQIEQYQQQAQAAGSQSKTLNSQIAGLNAQIAQINLQIRSLQSSIEETGLEITQTNNAIADAEQRLNRQQETLAQYLESTYENDRQDLAVMLLKNPTLGDFFDYIHSLQLVQNTVRDAIEAVRTLQDQLDQQHEDLTSRQQDLTRMQTLQQIQQHELAGTKSVKNQLLVQTKGQESKYQQLVKQGQANLQALQQEIYYLEKNGITVEDAVKYAKLAAMSVGIRPAFLLALLEVESRLGLNVGTGNWQDDMYKCYLRLAAIAKTTASRQKYLARAETEKSAFLKITSALGLDPDSVKVSREPSYGCGGAMGPAQFIPSTWLGYQSAVIAKVGHNPVSPWSTQDAFTAAAIKLANAGATSQTRTGEIAAAKAYIGGSPNCSQAICNSYSNTILQKAAQIEQNL